MWAEQCRVLPSAAATPGPMKIREAEVMRGVMRCAGLQPTRKITIMASPQVGKTAALKSICGYYLAEEPTPVLWLLPSKSLAVSFSRERVSRLLMDTTVLRGLYTPGSRDGQDAILYKAFHNGSSLALAYAGAPSQVAARPIRVLLADEVDRYPMISEGSPLSLAYQRTNTYRNSLIVQCCSPTWSESSRIAQEYNPI